MSRLLVLCILCAALITLGQPSNTAERVFTQPSYPPGTTFVMQFDKDSERGRSRPLIYRGEDRGSVAERYDFGRMVLSSSLRLKPKGRTEGSIGRMPVKFPFSLGGSWKYSLDVESSSFDCGTITEDWKAKVATSTETTTVAGQELEVVRIKHQGTFDSFCGEGNMTAEYLYSPKLGMYVFGTYTIYRPDGYVHVTITRTLTYFKLPSETSRIN